MTNTLKQKIQRGARTALVGGMTLLGVGCDYLNPSPRDVTRDEFDGINGSVYVAHPYGGEEINLFGYQLLIKDLDSDGQADIIYESFFADWMATEFMNSEEWQHLVDSRTRLMTPEIREAATRALQTDQDLTYLLTKENYRLYQERKQNEENQ